MKKKNKIRILIAENNRPMRNALETMLIELGFKDYKSVIDAETAWEKIEEGGVDIILSSLDLPGISGLELLNRIRNSKQYFNLPFVVITGEDQKVEILNIVEYEADYYLIKPFTIQSLGTLLDRIVRILSSPSRYDFAIYAGKYYYINNDLEKARKSFSIAVQINQEAALPFLYLGNIYFRLGNLEEAENAYHSVLNIERDYVGALRGLADIYQRKGNYRDLVYYLQKIVENTSTNFYNFIRLGNALLKVEDFGRAREYLIRAARIARGNPEHLTEVMEFFIEAGFVEDADDLFSKYFREDDDKTADFLNRLGRKCLITGQCNKGKAFLLGGLRLRPQHQELNLAIALLFYRLKDYNGARAHLKKVLRLNPDSVEAGKMLDRITRHTYNGHLG